ncbi:TPA: hypothetical protein DIC38_03580 [Candidatus Nomurabacteria bacterium]|nr:MAG: hypothetical protein O210_OD1C00001G0065 [Parcubacteria bacterium RAAC4_OD1_1]HCY26726.1 hypothetical protein [Candidatus Nomurabacteria bacterium]
MEYKSENKVCQNCKKDFIIEPDDFVFYEKIKVPAPTFCPECRMIRRMTWRNVRNLYKNTCKASNHNESIISIYSKDKDLVIYDQKYWWGDSWDPMTYGVDYDFSKPFLIQFSELLHRTPLPNVSNVNPVNSDYVNVTIDSKNCYLTFSSTQNEDCYYSEGINSCRNCFDILVSRNNEYLYNCVDCRNCFNVSFSSKSSECIDSIFLYDCRNCSNCFGCWNLRNKKYYIYNEQFSKEEYFDKLKSFNVGSFKKLEESKNNYKDKLKKIIHKFANINNSLNVSGNDIEHSRDCFNSFEINKTNNLKYVWRFIESGGSDCYDIITGTRPELCYESVGVGAAYNYKFGVAVTDTSNSHYSFTCVSGCSYLFGCVGLNSKQYCILNKQYTKEQYEELVPKIIQHMSDMPYIDSKGRVYKYGEFFPSELSPFAYNETIAQEYYPLTKEQAIEQGYKWKEKVDRDYNIDIKNSDIPDDINDTDESIVGKVIECLHKDCNHQCTEAFKIIPEEYQFYRRMNLPIPRLCPNCRHYERLSQRNPLKLWHRSCMKEGCTNTFETSYSLDRPEIVYCEKCYKQEVY